MKRVTKQNNIRERRARRVRMRIFGTAARPRIAFFRSNAANYGQAIDDENGKTVAAASSKEVTGAKVSKAANAQACGASLAAKLKKAGITGAVFDRRGYKYHGRTKMFAEGLRKGGIRI